MLARVRRTSDDFYGPRRGEMKDTGAYAGFLIGFIGAAPFGWSTLMASFEDAGDATMGVVRFAGVLITAGLAVGAVGFATGALVGAAWERRHRAANPRVKPEAGPDMATLTGAKPEDTMASVAAVWQRQARPVAAGTASFDSPNEVRAFALGSMRVVRVGTLTLGRVTCESGWRWSEHVGAALRAGDRHRAELAGHVLEGGLRIEFEGAESLRLSAGGVFRLPAAPHDLAADGDERCVFVLTHGVDSFAPSVS